MPWKIGWLVVLGSTVLLDNISVYIGPSPKERAAPTASAVGPCPTISQIRRTPRALEVYPAPSHHPTTPDALEEDDGKVSIGGRNITNLRFADDIDALAGNGWLVGWLFWPERPFETEFSLYWAVSHREGERRGKW